ncbi:hypothetical protein [Microcella sp.]|uniref:hypothetical protein n=1 Tax=Microcella sp. TaxID=1913979 RepID=UPI0033156B98
MSRRAAREAAERAAREAAAHESAPTAAPIPTPASPAFASSAPVAAPAEPAQRMRRRDFRPPSEQEASRSSFAPAFDEDAPLEYRTERPVDPPTGHRVAEPGPEDRLPSAPHVISEHTLSRRQLRSLRDASEPVQSADEVPAPLQHDAPPASGLTAPPADPAPYADLAPPQHHTLPSPAPLPPSAPVPPPLIEPEATPDERVEPSSSAPTTGSHWSVGVHDDEDPFENTFSREVGSASHSTNALVLPQMPESSLSGPVTGTGEIIVTGMIEVPRIVTSTGTVPSVHDSADVDDYVEPGDVELTSTGAAPVSALRAVSGHTGTGNIVHGKPQRNGNTLTAVLVAATVVMAVVAIGLFVLAAVNGLF